MSCYSTGPQKMALKHGDLLDMIQKSARNGTLLSSCEPEVRELMHQIDVLISGKQAEWAGQWAGLETQLREKERELAAVRHTLWERDTQVEQLRKKVDTDQKMSSDAAPHQSDLMQLRSELMRMTEKYEQLKARRRKHSTSQQSVSARKSSEEIHQLRQQNQALESVRVQLERERSVMEDQMNLARLEVTALQEKCSALEGEVKFCRSQLDQRDSLVAAIEQSSAVRAKQLEAQLKRTQELTDSREADLHKVRCECEERRRQSETASSEAQALNSHLSQSQAAARQLKGKFDALQLQLKKVENQLNVTETQLSQREQSIKLLQESSQRKDDLIRSLGGRQGQRSELSCVQWELSHAQSQLQSHLQQERSFRDEISQLKQRNATCRQQLARLTAECATKDQRLAEELAACNHKHTAELSELKSQLSKLMEEKKLAMEQKEAERETRLAVHVSEKQLRLPDDRLRAVEGSTSDRRHVCSSRNTATPSSIPPTSHSEHKSSAPITIPTGVPLTHTQPTPTHSTYKPPPSTSYSTIIQKFLSETDAIAHNTPKTTKHSQKSPTTTLHYPTCEEGVPSHTQPHSVDFTPLRPVDSGEDMAHKISTQTSFSSSSVRGDMDEESGRGGVEEGRGVRGGEGRGGGEGIGLLEVTDERRKGVPHLEDVFSKTLDSIVDRHFQQLDSSLKKLMTTQT